MSQLRACGLRSLYLRLETIEKLFGEFLRGPVKKTCSNTGNCPTHLHLGIPIHVRVFSVNGGEIHLAGELNSTPRRFSTSLHGHQVGLMFLWSRYVQGKFRFHRPNADRNARFPVFVSQVLQALKAWHTGGNVVHIQQICPDFSNGGVNRLST